MVTYTEHRLSGNPLKAFELVKSFNSHIVIFIKSAHVSRFKPSVMDLLRT